MYIIPFFSRDVCEFSVLMGFLVEQKKKTMKMFMTKQTMQLNGKGVVTGIAAVLFLLLLSALTSANAYQVGETFRDCETCPEMVVLPAGKFMMGERQVTISKPFAVGKYEVTLGQYAEFDRATEYETGNCGYPPESNAFDVLEEDVDQTNTWDNRDFKQTNNHPVACVNWRDAKTYASWLSAKTGHKYRLLSEAEWEYAAYGETTKTSHFDRAISPNQTRYDSDKAVAVGSYPANAFGLHDMHGNVTEWVEDCVMLYNVDIADVPTDGSAWTGACYQIRGTEETILRGGSYLDETDWASDFDSIRGYDYGFRVARTLTP